MSSLVKRVWRKLLPDPFDGPFRRLLERELADCATVLDLGCGSGNRLTRVSATKTAMDIYPPCLQQVRNEGLYRQIVCADARAMPFKSKTFDAVILIELIEHLEKAQGEALLEELDRVARRRVIVTTPNGYCHIPEDKWYGNPFRGHKCGWEVSEFTTRRYEVFGLHGLKIFRGDRGRYRIKPRWFGRLLSDATQPYVFHRPEKAFRLAAVKRLG